MAQIAKVSIRTGDESVSLGVVVFIPFGSHGWDLSGRVRLSCRGDSRVVVHPEW